MPVVEVVPGTWRASRRLLLTGALVLVLVVVVSVTVLVLGRSGASTTDGTVVRQPASVATLDLPGVPLPGVPAGAVEVTPPESAVRTAALAVTSYLTARRDGAVDAAYGLLSPAARVTYPTAAVWRTAVVDLPAPVTFTVDGAPVSGEAGEVTADVRRAPTLDAFTGFVAAQTREVYRAVRTGAGWRVDPAPVRATPALPPDTAAAGDVQVWLDHVVACDGAAAEAGQVSAGLLGDDSLPGALCAGRVPMTAGPAQVLSGSPDTAGFLAAYGPDLGVWARLVPVAGPDRQLLVGVAPIGASWRVFGIVAGTAR